MIKKIAIVLVASLGFIFGTIYAANSKQLLVASVAQSNCWLSSYYVYNSKDSSSDGETGSLPFQYDNENFIFDYSKFSSDKDYILIDLQNDYNKSICTLYFYPHSQKVDWKVNKPFYPDNRQQACHCVAKYFPTFHHLFLFMVDSK